MSPCRPPPARRSLSSVFELRHCCVPWYHVHSRFTHDTVAYLRHRLPFVTRPPSVGQFDLFICKYTVSDHHMPLEGGRRADVLFYVGVCVTNETQLALERYQGLRLAFYRRFRTTNLATLNSTQPVHFFTSLPGTISRPHRAPTACHMLFSRRRLTYIYNPLSNLPP